VLITPELSAFSLSPTPVTYLGSSVNRLIISILAHFGKRIALPL
jgi:hypothetical protein